MILKGILKTNQTNVIHLITCIMLDVVLKLTNESILLLTNYATTLDWQVSGTANINMRAALFFF